MKHRDGIIDLVRGLSALLVMLGHLRAFVFIDFTDAGQAGPLWKGFYLATGLGHQAVMVFFVLSGYFVGGSVLASLRADTFSPVRYATARLSRLWTVLIPTLVLTLLLDSLGNRIAPDAYAGGFLEIFCSGPSFESPASLGHPTFLGNLFFLQTIAVPVYGSNGPLWSLANEFWYYTLFPLLVLTLPALAKGGRQGTRLRPLACLALLVILVWWLPTQLLAYGLIWLMGIAVWLVANSPNLARHGRRWFWRLLPAPLFLATLAASKTDHWLGSDWWVGATFALWMPGLLGAWSKPGWWSRLSTALSELSYTLYVVHFPLLFFVTALAFGGRQWPPGATGLLIFTGFTLGVLAFSAAWWWLFERRTYHVRRWMNLLLRSRTPTP